MEAQRYPQDYNGIIDCASDQLDGSAINILGSGR
jgi:hypothetical protein